MKLKKGNAARFLSVELERRARNFSEGILPEVIQECVYIQKAARKINVELDISRPQEHLLSLLKEWLESEKLPEPVIQAGAAILQLLGDLNIHPDAFKKLLPK